MTVPDTIAHHPLIAGQLAALDARRLVVLQANGLARTADEVAEKFKDRFSYIRAWMTEADVAVWITIHASAMADVIALRRWLAERGYRLEARNEYPEEHRETHTLTLDGMTTPLVLNVHFPSAGTPGAACRYVQVGVVHKPVFKLQCDDAETVALA